MHAESYLRFLARRPGRHEFDHGFNSVLKLRLSDLLPDIERSKHFWNAPPIKGGLKIIDKQD